MVGGAAAIQGALGLAFASAVDAAAAAPETPAIAAGAPTGLNASRGTNEVILNWTAPSNEGSGIDQDHVQRDAVLSSTSTCAAANSTTEWADVSDTGSTSTTYIVSALTDTWYCYRVAAVNGAGIGAYSNTAGPTRRSVAISGAPTGLTATRELNMVSLRWTAPTYDGTIVGYRIQRQAATSSTVCGAGAFATLTDSGTATSYDENTTSDTWYCYRVAVINDEGAIGAYSNVAGPARRVSVPTAPSSLAATREPDQVSLGWSVPADTGGGSIAGYRIQRQAATSSTVCGSAAWSDLVANTGTSALAYVESTTSNSWYCYQVAAINGAGTGPFSNVAGPSRRLFGAPSAPSTLSATRGTDQVTLDWAAPLGRRRHRRVGLQDPAPCGDIELRLRHGRVGRSGRRYGLYRCHQCAEHVIEHVVLLPGCRAHR